MLFNKNTLPIKNCNLKPQKNLNQQFQNNRDFWKKLKMRLKSMNKSLMNLKQKHKFQKKKFKKKTRNELNFSYCVKKKNLLNKLMNFKNLEANKNQKIFVLFVESNIKKL